MTKTVTRLARSSTVVLLGSLALLPGCLIPAIAGERHDRVLQQSRFTARCSSMQVTSRRGLREYTVSGCGSTLVYHCYDAPYLRGSAFGHRHADPVDAAVALTTGGLDPDAPCALSSASLAPPAPRAPAPRAVAVARGPAAPSPEEVDEPGLSRGAAPASEPARVATAASQAAKVVPPRSLPSAAEVKQVLSALEPELRSCRAGGWVPVELRVAASGQLLSARVTGPVDASTRQCLEVGLGRARLAPFSDGPISLAYVLDLRPAPASDTARAAR